MYYVYELIDPRNNKPFYVGKGKKRRMYVHESMVRRNKKFSNMHLFNKINQILNHDKKIRYNIIKNDLSENEAYILEKRVIKNYGLKNLCNIKPGGSTGVKFTSEIKQKMSENHYNCNGENNPFFGKNHTNETLDLLRKPKSKEHKENIKQSLKINYCNLNKNDRKNRFGHNKGKRAWNSGIVGYTLKSKSDRINEKYSNDIIKMKKQNISISKITRTINEYSEEKFSEIVTRTILQMHGLYSGKLPKRI